MNWGDVKKQIDEVLAIELGDDVDVAEVDYIDISTFGITDIEIVAVNTMPHLRVT